MATVRFSKELKDEIVCNARNVFSKQIAAAEETRPGDQWAEFIYDKMFGEHVPALDAVPQCFLKMTDSIWVGDVGGVWCDLKFTLTTKRPWPNEFPDTELAKLSGYYGGKIILKDHLMWSELHAEVGRWQQGIKDARTREEEFVKQVETLINAHATLAPALKMWPALWDLVPEEYKNKHREIKVREKKEVVVDVNLGALTAAVAFNKLTR